MRRAVASVILLGAVSHAALADEQAERIKLLERRSETGVRLIKQLPARVNEPQRGARAGAPGQAAATASAAAFMTSGRAPVPTAGSLQEEMSQSNDSLSKRGTDFGLRVHGFADVRVAPSSAVPPSRTQSPFEVAE